MSGYSDGRRHWHWPPDLDDMRATARGRRDALLVCVDAAGAASQHQATGHPWRWYKAAAATFFQAIVDSATP